VSEGGTEIFSGKVVLKGWGYTLAVFKDRVHGTKKVGTISPFSSAFCYHYTRVSCTNIVSFMFTVTRLLCIINQQKICCA
jgi:hypothetical protein